MAKHSVKGERKERERGVKGERKLGGLAKSRKDLRFDPLKVLAALADISAGSLAGENGRGITKDLVIRARLSAIQSLPISFYLNRCTYGPEAPLSLADGIVMETRHARKGCISIIQLSA